MIHTVNFLTKSSFNTKLGPMTVVSDENKLYFLEFADKNNPEERLKKIADKFKIKINIGNTKPITLIKKEIKAYFAGKLTEFKTPYHLLGSSFQIGIWKELSKKIPYGYTKSYSEYAKIIDKPKAWRAIANALGANKLAIIIPCHRIIKNDGDHGDYSWGSAHKKWLIAHEKNLSVNPEC